MEDFRKTLEIITTSLYPDNKKRLVFIIDELDRCRPTYAAEVIEKIKHLFSVPGIIWVLVMNKEQMEKSISHVYGAIDASLYLSKFIDVGSSLPKNLSENIGYITSDHYLKLIEGIIQKSKIPQNSKGRLKEVVSIYAHNFHLSIRDAQRAIRNLELLFIEKGDYYPWYIILASFLSILKEKHHDIYMHVKNKTITVNELKERLDIFKSAGDLRGSVRLTPLYLQFALCKTESETQVIANVKAPQEIPGGLSIEDLEEFLRHESQFISFNLLKIKEITDKLDLFDFK
jgi:hypothetical protein